jgi:hypothetical protein
VEPYIEVKERDAQMLGKWNSVRPGMALTSATLTELGRVRCHNLTLSRITIEPRKLQPDLLNRSKPQHPRSRR